MNRKNLFIFLIAAVPLILLGRPAEYYLHIRTDGSNIETLTRMVSIDSRSSDGVFAYASEKDLQGLDKYGIFYEMLPHPGVGISAVMADSIEELREWDSYPSYEQYVGVMYQFAAEYPDICIIENIGTSVQGREILFVKISDNVDSEEDEPEFLYTGQMHGNEVISFMNLLHLIDYLLENYGVDPLVTNLIDSLEIWINPLANPDGTYITGNDSIDGAIRFNANGVDLNRNFPDWMDGPHPDGNDWQPENIAMMEFADMHTFVMGANLHSGAEVVNYPWDTTSELAADDAWWRYVSHEYADTVHTYAPWNYFNEFDDGITNGYAWYSINGGRADYMNYFKHCREVTLELSDVMILDEDVLLDHWEWNYRSLLNYMAQSMYGIQGTVTSSDGAPLVAEIRIPNHDEDNSHVVSDPQFGSFSRLLEPGLYDVEVSAWGYETADFNNTAVSWYSATRLDVSLIPLPPLSLTGMVADEDTGEPIADAVIQVLNTPLDLTNTNEFGEFSITDIFEGDYQLHIFAPGYSALMPEISLTPDITEFSFSLSASSAYSFESGSFGPEWTLLGFEPWLIVSSTAADGYYSAQSGDIDDDEFSRLSIERDIPEEGLMSFHVKISCENDENDDWDYLAFYIDDDEMARWDGNEDWQEVFFPVTPGMHRFIWNYHKDGSVSHYQDAAWVDMIQFPESELPPVMPGDVNLDEQVNVMDVIVTVNIIIGTVDPEPAQFLAADIDENGTVNVLDIIALVGIILGT